MSNHSDVTVAAADHDLKAGTLGWGKVAALGIAIGVSGNFSGWNYGLAVGGWGGMLVAGGAMALLFFGLTQCVAELAVMLPKAAGFDAYVEFAFGRTAGFMAGISVALGLAVGAGLAVSFAAGYCQGLFGIGGWPIKGLLLAGLFALQLRGASETAGWTMAIGFAGVGVLVAFALSVAQYFRVDNLFTLVGNHSPVLFFGGAAGAYRCIPFGLFFFIGIEQAAQAAADMRDVSKSMPRALMTAIAVITVLAFLTLLLATGSAGVAALSRADDPLLAAALAHPGSKETFVFSHLVGIGALIALIATLFSLLYAASRQFYYLAQARYLPAFVRSTSRREVPVTSLFVAVMIGIMSAAFRPESAMVIFIFLLSVSHLLIIAAFLRLRGSRPSFPRPYRALGGRWVASLACVLSILVMISCVQLEATALAFTIGGLTGIWMFSVARQRYWASPSIDSEP